MHSLRQLVEAACWRVSGVRSAGHFFRAIALLVPDATHIFVEGTPVSDVVALMQPYIEPSEYAAPAGTIWSWPQQNRRFTLRASPELFNRLAEAAARLAEPEICDHLHVYRGPEPLLNWFDAFVDPILVSKAIARDRVEEFCAQAGGALSDGAV